MSLTLETTQTLFRLGHFSNIVVDLGASMEGLVRLSPEHRLYVAHALFHAGDDRRSAAIVQAENSIGASHRVRSRCELICGLLNRRQGRLSAARNHFDRSFHLAHEARDHDQAAWAALHRLRSLAETEPPAALAALLRSVRASAALAADAHVSAYLHDSIALMEASVGRTEEARRHLRICQSLLLRNPNAWLEQVASMNAFFIDFLESKYSKALSHLRTAKRLTKLTGMRQRDVIECNEGHVLLAIGQFAGAIDRFRKIADVRSGPTMLAALDGLARTYLAMDGLRECERVLEMFDEVAVGNPALMDSFAGRWTAITRGKLLLRLHRFDEARQQAVEDLARARALDDRLLVGFLSSLEAEALAGAGRMEESSHALARAAVMLQVHVPDHLASYYRAAGTALMNSRHPWYRSMFARARNIWRLQGNRCATSELANLSIDRPRLALVEGVTEEMTAVTILGSACALAYNARLLGRELLEAIRVLECSPESRLREVPQDWSNHDADEMATLVLGDDGESKIVLCCVIPDEPSKAVLLTDIIRIGHAALALERLRLEDDAKASLWPIEPKDNEADAVFIADEMRQVTALARRVAPTNVPVLITGETGTGKEVLARLIHASSLRGKKLFLPFNCTATPREMLDSQLFGHRRGSFTGATDHFPGVIRAAAGGTLFLDEIGETTLDVQPKLLRFLESSEVHPVGEAHPLRVDVRVIAATNTDLDALVAEGRFRSDLLYRLNIIRIHVPPLRDRRVEIPALASYYLRKFAQENYKGELRLAEETIEFLLLYRWPGNVRQLANEMRRMAALAEKDAVLMPEHLSPDIAASRRTLPASDRVLDPTEVVVRLDQPLDAGIAHLERAMILHALGECGGRLEQTAVRLGLSRKGLYLKRQRLGLDLLPGAAAVDSPDP